MEIFHLQTIKSNKNNKIPNNNHQNLSIWPLNNLKYMKNKYEKDTNKLSSSNNSKEKESKNLSLNNKNKNFKIKENFRNKEKSNNRKWKSIILNSLAKRLTKTNNEGKNKESSFNNEIKITILFWSHQSTILPYMKKCKQTLGKGINLFSNKIVKKLNLKDKSFFRIRELRNSTLRIMKINI